MTAAWIKPPTAGPWRPRPKCDGQIRPQSEYQAQWRSRRYGKDGRDPMACIRLATVEIDGKHYCSLHGGEIALARLCEEGSS